MKIKLQNVRLSFPSLFEAEAFQDGPAKFSATLLVPKGSAQAKAIEDALVKVVTDKWGARGPKDLAAFRANPQRCAWQDGDNKDYDGYAGNMSLKASNQVRPLVINADRSPLTAADGKPYSGCYVNAIVEFYAYDKAGKGIGCSLSGIQFARDGEAFSGGRSASVDEFDAVTDGADADALV